MKTIHFDEIDSTNKYLIENHEKYDSFTFVDASYQTFGKGRNERKWNSKKDENLLFSILIKDIGLVNKYSLLSICSASLVMEALNEYHISNVKIKWPNDVYVNDKKICGILLQGSVPNYLVIGVGLNVNQKDFIEEYRASPTSVFLETNSSILIDEIKAKIYNKFLNIEPRINELIDAAIANDYLYQKEVKINDIKGVAFGINKDGSINVRKDNSIIKINTGEILLN